MALKVPEQHLPYVQGLLELSDEKIDKFLDALSSVGPKFNRFDLAADVSRRTSLGRRLTEGVIEVLTSLYLTRERRNSPVEAFVDQQVGPGLKDALGGSPEENEARWLKLRKVLMVSLALDETLGTAAKAGHVLTEHERIFEDARILTDVRPIFHPDLSEDPKAALLVHMLRITERNMFGQRSVKYFALDANDLRLLKETIERAIKKEATLKQTMKHAQIEILNPKATY